MNANTYSSFILFVLALLPSVQSNGFAQDSQPEDPLVNLGYNRNSTISESSGLSLSAFDPNAIWTHNDSGHAAQAFLLKTDGVLQATVDIKDANNQDWEAMTRFKKSDKNYLLIGDVGDNSLKRKSYQLYYFEEPKISVPGGDEPIKTSTSAKTIEFQYPTGSKNCEALAVDTEAKFIWLVEKVYYNSKQKEPPGIFTVPIDFNSNEIVTAKRVGSFPQRNVTGMAFSPDGKRLIIRNYLSAHLYSRKPGESWQTVLNSQKPVLVVFPLQRQGEAVCFTPDSKSLILTSEMSRQPIWKVNLQRYYSTPTPQPSQNSNPKAKQ